MDDRSIRIAIILIGHLMWLSTAALRMLRRSRAHSVRARAPWPVTYFAPLVWIPLLIATIIMKSEHELEATTQLIGLVIAFVGSAFGTWSMWSLGQAYGIALDLFHGHRLKTDGPFAVVRHPMYLAIIVYHVGASLALESLPLLAATALIVVPYTAIRIGYEEQVLRDWFGDVYDRYKSRTPTLVPLPR